MRTPFSFLEVQVKVMVKVNEVVQVVQRVGTTFKKGKLKTVDLVIFVYPLGGFCVKGGDPKIFSFCHIEWRDFFNDLGSFEWFGRW